ncbi:tol-pal system-associated acyl-CoA thioesterase [Pseudohoeflea coraliihabitans]|uniref:Tol-pal system-associated acyl-CoA thioesterase n=1 Tax=Pseudohoeflea coraliihabitans TaxID=2860393 RepID=A0ABS6WKX5_9HYPH|nr:tol-pal system-associated acyl-CoA thioesterase [Pseudohoeflea sp. DP4N28-3]MBW3096303.1 tol-pal system-associated acyl-CoA thioesterase [Pseudohoeflea sp. DP4N28-3]
MRDVSTTPHELAGELTDAGHVLRQRVYYEDTDFSGVVYHARYLHFLERGRTDMIRHLGVAQSAIHAVGDPAEAVAFVVRRMEIDFRSPARMDDVLIISTQADEVRGARMTLHQEIRREEDLLISAKVQVAVVNGFGRPRRLPDALAARLRISP